MNINDLELGGGDDVNKRKSILPKSMRMNDILPISLGVVIGLCFLLAYMVLLTQYKQLQASILEPNIKFSHNNQNQNTSVADEMSKKITVLCWVMTSSDEHKTKVIHIRRTWGRRCNNLIFASDIDDADINAIAIPSIKGSNALWLRTMESLRYLYKNYLDSADWFLKVDDDSYVIMENLRQMLYPYSKNMPIYFTCKVQNYDKEPNPFNLQRSGGYIFSKEAIKRFVERGIENTSKCRCYTGYTEAYGMAKCMENIRVVSGDTRDSQGRGRFLNFAPQISMFPSDPIQAWYKGFMENSNDEKGDFRYSDYAVSFINIQPVQMYVLEYLIYHLRPYGIHYVTDITPDRIVIDEMDSKMANISSRLYQILSEYDDIEN